MKKLILFDCDGTLVDSEPLCNVCLSEMLIPYRIELDPDEMVKKFRGMKLANILDNLSQNYKIEFPNDFVERYRGRLSEMYKSDLEPIAGIYDVLVQLRHQMAVVSNGPKSKIELALSVCGLSHFFGENLFSAYDIEVWKPDPKIYLFAVDKMGFKAENCIVVEDGLVGVDAAFRAGIRTLFFNRHGETNTFASDGVAEFSSMAELPGLVSSTH